MFTGRIFPSVKLRVSVSQLITLMIAATETPAGSLSVSRSRSLTIRSLHYARVNKKRKSARADIVEIDDKEPESKDEDDLVEDPRGWTQLKSKNLTLEEILDLESDKEVYSHKKYLLFSLSTLSIIDNAHVHYSFIVCMHFSFGMFLNHLSMSERAPFQSTM